MRRGAKGGGEGEEQSDRRGVRGDPSRGDQRCCRGEDVIAGRTAAGGRTLNLYLTSEPSKTLFEESCSSDMLLVLFKGRAARAGGTWGCRAEADRLRAPCVLSRPPRSHRAPGAESYIPCPAHETRAC